MGALQPPCRVATVMSQNPVTKYFRKAKEHGVQWQLNRSWSRVLHVAQPLNLISMVTALQQ